MELRFEELSKCPERFSRRLACIERLESLDDICDIGKGGAEPDVGEDGGEFLFVELVDGRWYSFFSVLDGWKALNTSEAVGMFDLLSPKEVELRLTYVASEVECGLLVNTEGVSDEKAL